MNISYMTFARYVRIRDTVYDFSTDRFAPAALSILIATLEEMERAVRDDPNTQAIFYRYFAQLTIKCVLHPSNEEPQLRSEAYCTIKLGVLELRKAAMRSAHALKDMLCESATTLELAVETIYNAPQS